MVRILIILSLIFGGIAAMAAPKDQNFDPLKQLPREDGTFRADGDAPTDAEIAMQMWRSFGNNKPMPEHLRRKYGIPDDPKGE